MDIICLPKAQFIFRLIIGGGNFPTFETIFCHPSRVLVGHHWRKSGMWVCTTAGFPPSSSLTSQFFHARYKPEYFFSFSFFSPFLFFGPREASVILPSADSASKHVVEEAAVSVGHAASHTARAHVLSHGRAKRGEPRSWRRWPARGLAHRAARCRRLGTCAGATKLSRVIHPPGILRLF